MKNQVTIIGNGILGTYTAYELKKNFPLLKVALVGQKTKPYSASLAAGAMHAAYAEIEGNFEKSKKEQRFFELALEARALWSYWLCNASDQSIKTSEHTILYSRKNGTKFEIDNYEAACKKAKADGCLALVSDEEKKDIFKGSIPADSINAIKIIGEFSMNVPKIFKELEKNLHEQDVNFIYENAKSIELDESNGFKVTLENNTVIYSEKVVVSAGSNTSNLLEKLISPIRIVHGVGSAFILDIKTKNYNGLNYVVRTPNRGGAQCGLHIVPFENNKYYVGAGNYLSSDLSPSHRPETIRYLIDVSESEILGRNVMYESQFDILIGYRPRSIDGNPLIGMSKKIENLYVASGTNRIGLTWAPIIASDIVSWVKTGKGSGKFTGWEPDRELLTWGGEQEAYNYFAESRISNLVEHNLLDLEDKLSISEKHRQFSEFAKEANTKIKNKLNLNDSFVIDPDLYTILLNE